MGFFIHSCILIHQHKAKSVFLLLAEHSNASVYTLVTVEYDAKATMNEKDKTKYI